MHLQKIGVTTLLTLAVILTLSNFSSSPNSPLLAKHGWGESPSWERRPSEDRVLSETYWRNLQSSPALAQTPSDLKVQVYQLFQQGKEHYQLSQFEAALQSWQQALIIYQELKDQEGERKTLGNLGLVYLALGHYTKALEFFQQQLNIARDIKDRESEGNALGNLGVTYRSLGDYIKALEYFQQQLNIAKEIHHRQGEGNALGNLGVTYRNLGKYSKAIEYLQQQLNIAREINDRQGEGNALGTLGNVYSALGNYDQAIEYYQQQLTISREIQDRKEEANAWGSLANTYSSQGDYVKAIDYYQQQLTISREIRDRHGEGLALNNLGLTFQKLGNLEAAEKTLMDGIKVREALRAELGDNDRNKVSIFETQAKTYRILQQVLIAQRKFATALEIAERGRTRAFVELLASRLALTTAQVPIIPPTIAQIQQIAKAQNSTLVQYSIVFSDLYIWVIKPTGEIAFRRVNLTSLGQSKTISLGKFVASSRESLGIRGRGFRGGSTVDRVSSIIQLQQLHQLLIKPIADFLPTQPTAHVTFIPQDSLFLVPFAALQDKDGKYLIEKHTILTAPSIQVLELTRKQRQRLRATPDSPLQNALVVGNPIMPSVPPAPGEQPQQLDSLPGAEEEALAIAPLLKTNAIIGKDATKSAIEELMPKARIIHLATHGILDDVGGIGSAIALAPDTPSSPPLLGQINGLLTAEQILDMKLNAELVVLSACDTGRGRITGDGVIGLSRSLISAGVPSVIVSLWSVPDAPTAFLMREFYRNLQQNPNKAQALRQAMLKTMQQHPDPRDWAAFSLIGEAE